MDLGVTKAMANAKETMTDGAFQQAGSVLSDAKILFVRKFRKQHHRR